MGTHLDSDSPDVTVALQVRSHMLTGVEGWLCRPGKLLGGVG